MYHRKFICVTTAFFYLACLCGNIVAQTTHEVTLSGMAFSPKNLTITVGDTVRWVWLSGNHDVESGTSGALTGDGKFSSGTAVFPPKTFEVVFDQNFLNANPIAGEVYPYYCSVHFVFGMTGTITVETCPNNCSGNGTCNSGVCTCDAGWTGVDCSTFTCVDVNNCSGNGSCAGPNTCDCEAGWSSTDCSVFDCNDVNNCSGNGTCVGANTCVCDVDHVGEDCSAFTCVDVNNCSGNGSCVSPNVCACEVGWSGADCSLFDCEGVNNCSGHGTCTGPDTCECDAGFAGGDCTGAVPAISDWGFAILGLLVVVIGVIAIRRVGASVTSRD